jgi:hypothetical protein
VGNRQHIGDVTVFAVKFSMLVFAPRPARPRLVKQLFGSAGQRAFHILRRIHRIDGVLDGRRLGNQPFLAFVPGADGKQDFERNRMPLHERGDFLLLLVHHGQQRKFFLAGVVAGNAVVLLFLLD